MLISKVRNKVYAVVDVQNAVELDDVPSEEDIRSWVEAVLLDTNVIGASQAELTVRIVDQHEISELNQQYRNKQGPTNVLSFPADHDLPLEVPLLGDLVICAAIVMKEAHDQGKPLMAHWAHMVVHGTLHLLGYDHTEENQAAEMEQKEISILKGLGFSDPYEVTTES
jgi:probable rRNA maturation factor